MSLVKRYVDMPNVLPLRSLNGPAQIEIEVPIELSNCQKRLYRGLKDQIPVEDLLVKSSMESANDAGIDSLMNLVMQFRKVPVCRFVRHGAWLS